jgi:hypothetical protein
MFNDFDFVDMSSKAYKSSNSSLDEEIYFVSQKTKKK